MYKSFRRLFSVFQFLKMSGRLSSKRYSRNHNESNPQVIICRNSSYKSFSGDPSGLKINDIIEFPSLSVSADKVENDSVTKVQQYSDKLKSSQSSNSLDNSIKAKIPTNQENKDFVSNFVLKKPEVRHAEDVRSNFKKAYENNRYTQNENPLHLSFNKKNHLNCVNGIKETHATCSRINLEHTANRSIKHNVDSPKLFNNVSVSGSNSNTPIQHLNENQANKEIKCKLMFNKVKLNSQGENGDELAKKAKRKKRKSKIKRQAALQSGKINLLTPEVHSKILNQVNAPASKNTQYILSDLNNEEEYPELGKPPPTPQKKNLFKEETLMSATLENEMVSDLPVVKQTVGAPDSEQNASKDTSVKEKKKKSNKPVHPKDPITLKFLDMLISKPSKLPKEKELTDEIETPVSSGLLKIKSKKDSCHAPNLLDSSGPLIKRGKERETPKPKKPSHLKKIILLDRRIRKEHLLQIKANVNQEQNELHENKSEMCNSTNNNGEAEVYALCSAFEEENNNDLQSSSHLQDLSDKIQETPSLSTHKDKLSELDTLAISECSVSSNTINHLNEAESNFEFLFENFNNASEKEKAAKILLHTRNFREYCDHLTSKDIDDAVHTLLDDLARFQDRLHQKDPVKARAKKRMIYGVKEVKKYIKLKKLKCIILATDIENVITEGGLNDILNDIKILALEHRIPCVFALARKALGKVCHKPVPVSCIGVFNADGSEANFKKIMELLNQSKHDYVDVLKNLAIKLTEEEAKNLIKARKEAPETLHNVKSSILRRVYLSFKGQEITDSSTEELNCEFTDSNDSE